MKLCWCNGDSQPLRPSKFEENHIIKAVAADDWNISHIEYYIHEVAHRGDRKFEVVRLYSKLVGDVLWSSMLCMPDFSDKKYLWISVPVPCMWLGGYLPALGLGQADNNQVRSACENLRVDSNSVVPCPSHIHAKFCLDWVRKYRRNIQVTLSSPVWWGSGGWWGACRFGLTGPLP